MEYLLFEKQGILKNKDKIIHPMHVPYKIILVEGQD